MNIIYEQYHMIKVREKRKGGGKTKKIKSKIPRTSYKILGSTKLSKYP